MANTKASSSTSSGDSGKPSTTKAAARSDEKSGTAGTTRTGVDPTYVADTEVLGKDIDTRMKALLKDHQEMGARPPDSEQKKLDKAGE